MSGAMFIPEENRDVPHVQFADLMTDIETLDTGPNASVLSVALVAFDRGGEDTEESIRDDPGRWFYTTISRDSNAQHNRTESGSTLAWWAEQNKAAWDALTDGEQQELPTAMRDIRRWFQALRPRPQFMWANDPDFDVVILRQAAEAVGSQWIIPFWSNRSLRTIKDLAYPNGDAPRIGVGTAHNALDDTIRQVLLCQHCYRVLNNRTEPSPRV